MTTTSTVLDRPLELDNDNVVDLPPTNLVKTPIGRVEVGDSVYVANRVRLVVEREDLRGVVTLRCDPRFVVTYAADREVSRLSRPSETDALPTHLIQREATVNPYEDALHTKSLEKSSKRKERSLREVADEICVRVVREDRQTVEVQLSQCDLDSFGRLVRPTHEPLVLLDHAYRGLATRAPSTAQCPSNLREWMPNSKASASLRTLWNPSGEERCAFAAVSKKYTTADMHVLADALARAMPDCASASYHYDGDGGRWEVTATLDRPWEIAVAPGTTEPHRAQIVLGGYDNGAGSVRVRFRVERLACTNGLRLIKSPVSCSVRHVGEPEKVATEIAQALSRVDDAMEEYASRWANLHGSFFSGVVTTDDGRGRVEKIDAYEALKRLLVAGVLPTNGRRAKSVWPLYREAFEAEPGDSAAAVVNAVTRFAHEGALASTKHWTPSKWAQEDVEDRAELLFAHVAVALQPVPDEGYEWLN